MDFQYLRHRPESDHGGVVKTMSWTHNDFNTVCSLYQLRGEKKKFHLTFSRTFCWSKPRGVQITVKWKMMRTKIM